ncbi:MAG TPA: hypothetical protein VFS43_21195 [Polyangiaceae bacterium]|nr:hypothetical protein [Polyangiaceae bacterium]
MAALVWAAVGCGSSGGSTPPTPAFDMKASAFFDEYDANAVVANVKFKGQVVRLTGAAEEPDQRGGPVFVAIATAPAFTRSNKRIEARCELEGVAEKSVIGFRVGSVVKMTGRVRAPDTSPTGIYVPLEGCTFEVVQKAE